MSVNTLTAAEKARASRALATCPDWCGGTVHLEGGYDHHTGQVGTVASVALDLHQSIRDDGDPGPIGLVVWGDEHGDNPLTLGEVDELIVALTKAREMLRAAQV